MLIIVETFCPSHENSGSEIRVRPLSGQGFGSEMRVECSKRMRTNYPIGQLFLIDVAFKSKENGPDHLYSYHGNVPNPVTRESATAFIQQNFKKH